MADNCDSVVTSIADMPGKRNRGAAGARTHEHIFTEMDEPVPDEREMLFKGVQQRVDKVFSEQKKLLLDYLSHWDERQRNLISKLLEDSFARRDEKSNGDDNRIAAEKDSHHIQYHEPYRQNFVELDWSLKCEEVEAASGWWIDREGGFNEGRQLHVQAVQGVANHPVHLEPVGDQYFASVSQESGLTLSRLDENRVELSYAFMWGSHGKLIVFPPDLDKVWRLERVKSESLENVHTTMGRESAGAVDISQLKTEAVERFVEQDVRPRRPTVERVVTKVADMFDIVNYAQPQARNCLASFVFSTKFEASCAFVIICNSIVLAAQLDHSRKNLDQAENSVYEKVDLAFSVFYILELILRIVAYRCAYFFCPDWKWNLFDTILVASAVNDQLAYIFGWNVDVTGGGDVVFLRVLRLLKMLKLLRMIRLMKIFRELRLILNSVLTSMKAMMWSVFLIIVVIFLFGMVFLQAVTNYLREHPDLPVIEVQELNERWGSVGGSLISMYMASMDGDDWKHIAEPLQNVGGFFYGLFIMYTGFYTCVIANTLTSLFVEATISNSDTDQRQVIQEELHNKEQYMEVVKKWYDFMDKDHSGFITTEEIEANLHTPEMMAFAKRMEIHVTEVQHFFNIISCNGKRPVDLETFVVGCIKLKGTSRSIDLIDLVFSHQQMSDQQARFVKFVEDEFFFLRKQFQEDLDMMLDRQNCALAAGGFTSENGFAKIN